MLVRSYINDPTAGKIHWSFDHKDANSLKEPIEKRKECLDNIRNHFCPNLENLHYKILAFKINTVVIESRPPLLSKSTLPYI